MPRDKTPPPADLDDTSKALWKLTKAQLREQGTWEDSDAKTLERYVRADERARVSRSALPVVNGVEQHTAEGSQGQLVQHPNVKTAREAERDAHEYAKELLLTPKARQQHELAKQAAKGGKFDGAFGD